MSPIIAKCSPRDKNYPQLITNFENHCPLTLKLSFLLSWYCGKNKLPCDTNMYINFGIVFCTDCLKKKFQRHCKNEKTKRFYINVEVTLKYFSHFFYFESTFEILHIFLLRSSHLKIAWYLLQSNKLLT